MTRMTLIVGSIIDGVYYPHNETKYIDGVTSMYEEDRRQAQRNKYRKDILQSSRYGKPNPEFYKAYPERILKDNLTTDQIREMRL